METGEKVVLKTIETLKNQMLSLLSSDIAEEKLSQIKEIIQRWFLETSWFDMDSNPDYSCIKESIADETINNMTLMLFDTYNAFYDIVKILDMNTDED